MPRYTQLSEKEIVDLTKSFNIGQIDEYEPLSGGSENSSFLITTSDGRYILTICEDKSFEQIDNLIGLLKHLETHRYRTSRVIEDDEGNYVKDFGGSPVYLKEYLNGENVSKADLNLIKEIGVAIAKLHEVPVLSSLPTNFPYGLKYFGEVIGSGTPEEVAADPKVIEAYIGED